MDQEATKLEYWIDSHITMPWHEWLCKHNYHRIVWESAEGYQHCQCGQAVLNDLEDLENRINEILTEE